MVTESADLAPQGRNLSFKDKAAIFYTSLLYGKEFNKIIQSRVNIDVKCLLPQGPNQN